MLVTVTFAFATTAPLLSVMVPVMPALACPDRVRGTNSAKHVIATAMTIRRIRIAASLLGVS
jgi:hypothetical protein